MNQQERIRAQFKRLQKKQLVWRRHLHQYPELSNQEVETTKFIRRETKRMGLKSLPIDMKTGHLAQLKGKHNGPTLAIRADIDALPIHEKTALPFRSRNDGCMHACGHDMHTATLLGVAELLSQMRNEVCGTVRFIFQPAEEQPPGGARPMIENGALDSVSAILGLHVDPTLPTGRISVSDGVAMASVNDFNLVIKGTGGHAAKPHTGVDAIVTAAEVIESLQKISSREIDPITPIVISIGKIEGGTARNIVADSVHLAGTARALSQMASRRIPALIKRTVAGVCKARGARYEFTLLASYPVLSNDPSINRLYERNFASLFGRGKIEQTPQTLGGEDFACYLERVPGAMFRLGVGNRKIKADKPWHSPEFIADENALAIGTMLLTACALDYLEEAGK